MAYVRPRGNSWFVEVCKKGVRDCATFDTDREARDWGIKREAEILAGKKSAIAGKTFKDLLDRYVEKTAGQKGGARWEAIRCAKIGRDVIGAVPLTELAPSHFADWRDRVMAGDKPLAAGSVRREMNLMSAALRLAVEEWGWLPAHPLEGVKRPKKPDPRYRRITPEERTAVLQALDYRPDVPPTTATARTGAAFDFAIETGMRSGEILRLTAADDHGRYVKVRRGKTNAAKRDVPLTPRARAIVDQLLELKLRTIFGLDDDERDALFRKGTERALIADLTFHDTRHEAASWMSKIVPVQVLAKILGVVDLRTLMTVYYNPTGHELADHLTGSAPVAQIGAILAP